MHHVKSRVKTSCVLLSIPRRPRPRAYFTLQEDKQKKKINLYSKDTRPKNNIVLQKRHFKS